MIRWFTLLLFVSIAGLLACGSDDGVTTPVPIADNTNNNNNSTGDTGGGPAPTPVPGPDPRKICVANNFIGQSFEVIAVSGKTITAGQNIVNCPSLKGEVRRNARKLQEFVGDITSINGNQITVNTGILPPSTMAKKGETLKVIWKPRRHKKN